MGDAKKALFLTKDQNDDLKSFLKSLSIGVVLKEDKELDGNIAYLFVENADGTFFELQKKYSVKENDVRIVSLTPVADMNSFMRSGGQLVMDPKWLSCELGTRVLRRFFIQKSNLPLNSLLQDLAYNFKTIRLAGHMKSGYYSDLLVEQAILKGFNPIKIRNFYNSAVYFLNYLKESQIGGGIYDIEFGFTEENFVFQIQASVKNFVQEYIENSFSKERSSSSLNNLLYDCLVNTDFMDINHWDSNSKIIISGIWNKVNRQGDFFPSFSTERINSVDFVLKDTNIDLEDISVAIENHKTNISQTLGENKLPGQMIDFLVDAKSVSGIELQKMAMHIQQKRIRDMKNSILPGINFDHIDNYLRGYHNIDTVLALSDEDKMNLVSELNEPNVLGQLLAVLDQCSNDFEITDAVIKNATDVIIEDLKNEMDYIEEGDGSNLCQIRIEEVRNLVYRHLDKNRKRFRNDMESLAYEMSPNISIKLNVEENLVIPICSNGIEVSNEKYSYQEFETFLEESIEEAGNIKEYRFLKIIRDKNLKAKRLEKVVDEMDVKVKASEKTRKTFEKVLGLESQKDEEFQVEKSSLSKSDFLYTPSNLSTFDLTLMSENGSLASRS